MLPNFRSLTDSSCLLYDLPGLEDTRGSSYEILNAVKLKDQTIPLYCSDCTGICIPDNKNKSNLKLSYLVLILPFLI